MEILYMGTAAAEGYPALFCNCQRCVAARKLGGRNIRTRSQALIDEKILIDFNADSLYHSNKYGIDFTYINTLLITHTHPDHFYESDLATRRKGMAYLENCQKLNIYGSCDLRAPLDCPDIMQEDKEYGCNFNAVLPYKPFYVEGYKITALRANHGTVNPYMYIIEKDGKSILYAHDTGLFLEEVWKYIVESKAKFNIVSLDCTEGTAKIDYDSHMNFERNIITKQRLIENGAADNRTEFVLNHFSHNGTNTLYEEFSRIAGKEGFNVSYDGMRVLI